MIFSTVKIRMLSALAAVALASVTTTGCNAEARTRQMFKAVETNNVRRAKLLIGVGADVNARRDNWGETALMIAARHNSEGMARLLIGAGADVDADVDARDNEGQTALMLATKQKSLDIAKLLIEAGADVDARDDGQTEVRRKELSKYSPPMSMPEFNLFALVLEPMPVDGGYTALMYAAANDFPDIARLLIDAGADVDARGDDGQTALMTAARNNSLGVLQLLIDSDAKLNATDKDGRTALDHAVGDDAKDAERLLRGAGARQGSEL